MAETISETDWAVALDVVRAEVERLTSSPLVMVLLIAP
jgi:hypothetical protein